MFDLERLKKEKCFLKIKNKKFELVGEIFETDLNRDGTNENKWLNFWILQLREMGSDKLMPTAQIYWDLNNIYLNDDLDKTNKSKKIFPDEIEWKFKPKDQVSGKESRTK